MTTRIDATAAPAIIRLKGKDYRISPMTDEDIAYLDKYVRNKHIRGARESLTEDDSEAQRRLTESVALMQASSMTFMSGKGAEIIQGIEGWAQILWCGLRKNHPKLEPSDVARWLVDPETLEDAQKEWKRLNAADEAEQKAETASKKKKKAVKKKAKKSRRRNR